MANLKIPSRTLNDEFLLEDYQDDFNALNDEISELKTNLNDEISELKTNGRVDKLVVENGLVVNGNAVLNSGKTLYVGNTEYYEGAINNWAKNDNFVLHLNNGKCFVPSDGINRNNSLGHPEQPWQDLYIGLPSIGNNGFTKLPNGLVMQWGEIQFSEATGHSGVQKFSKTVDLPVQFNNALVSVQLTPHTNSYDSDKIKTCVCRYDLSGQTCVTAVISVESAGAWHTNVKYMAIGY